VTGEATCSGLFHPERRWPLRAGANCMQRKPAQYAGFRQQMASAEDRSVLFNQGSPSGVGYKEPTQSAGLPLTTPIATTTHIENPGGPQGSPVPVSGS